MRLVAWDVAARKRSRPNRRGRQPGRRSAVARCPAWPRGVRDAKSTSYHAKRSSRRGSTPVRPMIWSLTGWLRKRVMMPPAAQHGGPVAAEDGQQHHQRQRSGCHGRQQDFEATNRALMNLVGPSPSQGLLAGKGTLDTSGHVIRWVQNPRWVPWPKIQQSTKTPRPSHWHRLRA